MKKAIICHGVSPSREYALAQKVFSGAKYWLGWLQQQYLLHGVNCQVPAFSNSWVPYRDYNEDVKIFERLAIDEDTRLIGHSCGAALLLKYLSENPHIKIRHLVLVAPGVNAPESIVKNYQTTLDAILPQRVKRIDLFYSDDEPIPFIKESVEKIIETYPNINIHRFTDRGHFNDYYKINSEFPELWEVCKSEI